MAGHRGMVGSALIRELVAQEYTNIITRSHEELNLINQGEVERFFSVAKPDVVYLAAAKVGGIYANNVYPAEFIYQNLMIQTNVIHQAYLNGVKKLLFLGSSCIYPKNADLPLKEVSLLSGPLEQTNEPYAIAKIAGLKMVESYNRQYSVSHGIDYRSIMPTNLYGPGDSYHPENSHVVPALIQKFHLAKTNKLSEVLVWGSGKPRREFLFVDDLAKASVYVMNLDAEKMKNINGSNSNFINVGTGSDITINELANLIKKIIGYEGDIRFDISKPDGTDAKLLDVSYLQKNGWISSMELEKGLSIAYEDFLRLSNKN